MKKVKLRRNFLIRSEICRNCARVYTDDCVNTIYLNCNDERILAGVQYLGSIFDGMIVHCPAFEKQIFVSDFLKFLDRWYMTIHCTQE